MNMIMTRETIDMDYMPELHFVTSNLIRQDTDRVRKKLKEYGKPRELTPEEMLMDSEIIDKIPSPRGANHIRTFMPFDELITLSKKLGILLRDKPESYKALLLVGRRNIRYYNLTDLNDEGGFYFNMRLTTTFDKGAPEFDRFGWAIKLPYDLERIPFVIVANKNLENRVREALGD